LERKAETVLFLDKDNEVTVVYSTRTRRAPITKQNAPCFKWCDEAKAHVSVDYKSARSGRLESNQKGGRAIPFEVEDLQKILPQFGGKVTRANVNDIAREAESSVRTVWSRWKNYKEIQEKGTE
jgi:hypothetical protein